MSNIRKANIRFDMDNELHRKAWQLLQDRDKNIYPSYSQTVIYALTALLSEHTDGLRSDKTNAEFLPEIAEVVDRAAARAIERTLPSFLAGYMACAAGFSPVDHAIQQIPAKSSTDGEADDDTAADIDFDFLGLN